MRGQVGCHSGLPYGLDGNAEGLGDIVMIDFGAKTINRLSKIHVYDPIDRSLYMLSYTSLLNAV